MKNGGVGTAEKGKGLFAFGEFIICRRAFHGQKASAHSDERHAELREKVQTRDRTGDDKVKAFAHLGGGFLRAEMEAVHIRQSQNRTGLLLELDALLGAVQKGQGEVGTEKLQIC